MVIVDKCSNLTEWRFNQIKCSMIAIKTKSTPCIDRVFVFFASIVAKLTVVQKLKCVCLPFH